MKVLYFVSSERNRKILFLLFLGVMSFSNWKTTIYCILIIMVMIATNLTVTGSKMNGEMFFDLRRADLQDLFPSAEEFSFRKKIFDFLEDVVSTIWQHEKYIMFEKVTAIKTFCLCHSLKILLRLLKICQKRL